MRNLTEPPDDTPVVVESLDTPARLTPCAHEFIHSPCPVLNMPKRRSLPHPDDEILSGYEEDASSLQDGCTAWVMADPAATLEGHLVNKGGANPSIAIPMTGGTIHPIQSIDLTATCPLVCLSRHASAFWTGIQDLDEARQVPSKNTLR